MDDSIGGMSQHDKRMLWIRSVCAATGDVAIGDGIEAELASEVLVPGLLSYGDGRVLCGPTTFHPDTSGLFKYCLRLQLPPPAEPDVVTDIGHFTGTKKGYAFRDGPIGELVALFSLTLQVRLYLLSTTIGALTDHGVPRKTEYWTPRGRFGPQLDDVLFTAGGRNLTTLAPFLDEVSATAANFHLRLATAANHYARAIRDIGLDDEMVFVRLVSAIETAAVDQPIPDDLLANIAVENCIRLDSLTGEQIEEVRQLFATRKTKARFVAFLQKYSVGFFDAEAREPAHIQVTPENLRAVAGAVYDARSGYLHSGDPMYLSQRIPAFPAWHSDPSVGMVMQNREFTAKQKLPHVGFFHRLVRFCLLAYMRTLREGPAEDPLNLTRAGVPAGY